jgi:hypothetical protein
VFGPFSAGDSFRVYRLQRKGVSLDLQSHLLQAPAPLREAWLAFVTQQSMGQPTYVLSDLHDGEGFIQVRYRPHQAAADVTFLAPSLEANGQAATAWSRLLEGAGTEAAGRGIQRVFASLPESGAEEEIFYQAGFMLYAREDIYCLAQVPAASPDRLPAGVRPQRPEDWPAIQKLCVAITPQRVRQYEGGIMVAAGGERTCQRYVLPGQGEDELLATVTLYPGNRAHWLRLMVHPEARDVADDLVRWGLSFLGKVSQQVIYCNVRQYEGGLRVALQDAGFEPHTTQALTVKHTVAWSKAPAQDLAAALKSAEVVPPAYRINGEADLRTGDGRLAATKKS